MKKRNSFYIPLLILLFIAGCEKIELDQPFNAMVGDKFRIDQNLSVSIDSVSDYRCPVDVMCVWAGDVDIFVRLNEPFRKTDTIINLYNPDRNPLHFDGYQIKVLDVEPHQKSTETTPQKDFRIKMVILKE